MPKVDECVSDIVSAHKMSGFTVIANQQCAELVNPGEGPFAAEAALVDFRIEGTFGSAFSSFARALVFGDVGNELVVEARPASGFGVKGRVGIARFEFSREVEENWYPRRNSGFVYQHRQ